MLALATWQTVLIVVAAVLTVALIVFTVLVGLPRFHRRRGGPDIPPGMKPGPSDPDLEKPNLERLQAWGILLIVIMAVWIPVYWLREAKANEQDLITLQQQSIERGRLTTMPGGEENQFGFNCERCHGQGLGGGLNVYNGAFVQVPNLQTVCGGAKYGHPLITGIGDIVNTISQGRDGTDMPSWSVLYKGAMNDLQIQDLVNYIISIQTVPDADNLCTNPNAAAATASPSPSPSASASASPSPSASPQPSPSASGSEQPGALSITAKNIAFDPTTLSAPAGQPFTIDFDNQDAGVQHDVAIFEGSDATAPVAFRGDLVTGVASVTYNVPALPAGSYFFHCDVHPTMTGTLTVG
jgi:plastocyanin/mono/diheme cytochrome c family protein